MRFQSGIRFDKMTFNEFKELCGKEGYKPNEILERFMKTCLDKKTTNLWSQFDQEYEDHETICFNTLNLLHKIECEIVGIDEILNDEDEYLTPSSFDNLVEYVLQAKDYLPYIKDKELKKGVETLLEKAVKKLAENINPFQ